MKKVMFQLLLGILFLFIPIMFIAAAAPAAPDIVDPTNFKSLGIAMGGGLAGIFSHIISKKVKGETAHDVWAYFAGNFKWTLVAIFGMIGLLFVTYDPNAVWYAIFFSGYTAGWTADSGANKPPD